MCMYKACNIQIHEIQHSNALVRHGHTYSVCGVDYALLLAAIRRFLLMNGL
jgi:hypothetical protein